MPKCKVRNYWDVAFAWWDREGDTAALGGDREGDREGDIVSVLWAGRGILCPHGGDREGDTVATWWDREEGDTVSTCHAGG